MAGREPGLLTFTYHRLVLSGYPDSNWGHTNPNRVYYHCTIPRIRLMADEAEASVIPLYHTPKNSPRQDNMDLGTIRNLQQNKSSRARDFIAWGTSAGKLHGSAKRKFAEEPSLSRAGGTGRIPKYKILEAPP